MHQIKVKRDILAERSHGGPARFTAGQQLTGRLHKEMRGDLVCFFVSSLDDFVYFPADAITYEPMKDKNK